MRGAILAAAFSVMTGCGGPNANDGAIVYTATCATCHGASGGGIVEDAADLRVRVPAMTDEQIEANILNGTDLMDPVDLTEDEIADVIAYLRETFPGGG
jgi:mono/diheme cytochrome c family protein